MGHSIVLAPLAADTVDVGFGQLVTISSRAKRYGLYKHRVSFLRRLGFVVSVIGGVVQYVLPVTQKLASSSSLLFVVADPCGRDIVFKIFKNAVDGGVYLKMFVLKDSYVLSLFSAEFRRQYRIALRETSEPHYAMLYPLKLEVSCE